MPQDTVYKTCPKCGKKKKETDFYIKRNGERCDLCKQCLTMYVDNRRPDTFKWILKEIDVPYVESKWVEQANKAYMKNPAKFGPMSVLGTYLRTMRMNQYADCGYEDSDKLNNADYQEAKKQMNRLASTEIDEEFEQKLLDKLEAGEISQAQYNTMSRKSVIDMINEKMKKAEEDCKDAEEDAFVNNAELEVPENTLDESNQKDVVEQAKEMAKDIAENGLPPELEKKRGRPAKSKEDHPAPQVPEETKEILNLVPDIASTLGVNPVENIQNDTLSIGADNTNQFIPDVARIDESQISSELTPDDIKYLSLKWGLLYKPSEWVKMEELYQKYAADYELSTDREQVLKNICKTDLKMNQALDVGDVKTFKDLQSANDMLRKSGKFKRWTV